MYCGLDIMADPNPKMKRPAINVGILVAHPWRIAATITIAFPVKLIPRRPIWSEKVRNGAPHMVPMFIRAFKVP